MGAEVMSVDINTSDYINKAWRNVDALEDLTGQIEENSFELGGALVWIIILIVFFVGFFLAILFLKKIIRRV
jgi:hypothetical protein